MLPTWDERGEKEKLLFHKILWKYRFASCWVQFVMPIFGNENRVNSIKLRKISKGGNVPQRKSGA